jgi:hypothetical protein
MVLEAFTYYIVIGVLISCLMVGIYIFMYDVFVNDEDDNDDLTGGSE